MNVRNGSNIGYTSYNLPNVINAGAGYSSTLSYGAFRNRFKQIAVTPTETETTIYVAGIFEKVTRTSSGTEYRHRIQGGRGTAAIYTRSSGGSGSTAYVHTDHLGSPELITGSSGNVLVRPSFGAYGERRDGSDWDGPPSAGDLATIANLTRRGFTGHEHLDAVGLIHMNGRVFEPIAGRFLSRDPIIDGFASSQGMNGYAYVHNRPLTFTDPSGFCGGVGEIEECHPDSPRSPQDLRFPWDNLGFYLDAWTRIRHWRFTETQYVPFRPELEWDGLSFGATGVMFGADDGSVDKAHCTPPAMDTSASIDYDPLDPRYHRYRVKIFVGFDLTRADQERLFNIWRNSEYAAPGIYANAPDNTPILLAKRLGIPDTNWVYLTTDEENLTWTNVTLPGHRLDPGKVKNSVVTKGRATYLVSEGSGYTEHRIENIIFGHILFSVSQQIAIKKFYGLPRAIFDPIPRGSCNPN